MIKKNFDEVWNGLSARVKHELRRFFEHPTERNGCYVFGYICAYSQLYEITRDEYTYLMALIPKVEESNQVRKEVLEWSKA